MEVVVPAPLAAASRSVLHTNAEEFIRAETGAQVSPCPKNCLAPRLDSCGWRKRDVSQLFNTVQYNLCTVKQLQGGEQHAYRLKVGNEGLNPWRQKGEYWLNAKVSEIPRYMECQIRGDQWFHGFKENERN